MNERRREVSKRYDQNLEIPQPYTVNINTASGGRLQQVAKANDVAGLSGFFKNLVKEKEDNGNFRNINDVERRMSGVAKESHIDKLEILIDANKLIF
ncbi:helix-hairpin-helix domain-containing protein [Chryseobacterium gambrini]|uniref:Helix-hairpin-helix domain-containing protein n=1 Tax=Chryseobacterium gambrini TaxID=373672 RepID=A0AAJ1R605_9FLAO|nr:MULTISPECIES: helix-hairpin-helix domain-containing protein [Chryseobacterium]MDN4013705.1 helix-hairpin-helix domain-containing protein [Chryseobacterium gambrini]MDN4028070.1 helix-hairpin-helix domain-containing protein [Chryseobacterium gambrini]QWA39786.1 hypothetical protein KKI44_06145 [Chryseobacterium sp. ZHDP1]